MFWLVVLVVIGTTIWVWADAASQRNSDGSKKFSGGTVAGYVLGCLVLRIVAFPVYLVYRRHDSDSDSKPKRVIGRMNP
jgi:hypothetical protein